MTVPPGFAVPYDPGVLYHYCPTAAFYAIVSTNTIRLSSLSLSNDTSEGKLVADTLWRLADRDKLDSHHASRLQESLAILDKMFDGLGFCLCEEGDRLSQWRGYADDGTGVSIGFSTKYLSERTEIKETGGFSLEQVVYDPTEHERIVEPTYREIRKLIDDGAFKIGGIRTILDSRTDDEIEEEAKAIRNRYMSLSLKILPLALKMFTLKSHAFSEEQEWRLLAYLAKPTDDECSFHPTRDRLTPFRTFELAGTTSQPLARIVLGPKHLTPIDLVERFLNENGFEGVPVERSIATYR